MLKLHPVFPQMLTCTSCLTALQHTLQAAQTGLFAVLYLATNPRRMRSAVWQAMMRSLWSTITCVAPTLVGTITTSPLTAYTASAFIVLVVGSMHNIRMAAVIARRVDTDLAGWVAVIPVSRAQICLHMHCSILALPDLQLEIRLPAGSLACMPCLSCAGCMHVGESLKTS